VVAGSYSFVYCSVTEISWWLYIYINVIIWPKCWEFVNHVKYSGDFFSFVLLRIWILSCCVTLYCCSSLGCTSMPLGLFPTTSTARGSEAQGGRRQFTIRVRVPGIDLGNEPGGSAAMPLSCRRPLILSIHSPRPSLLVASALTRSFVVLFAPLADELWNYHPLCERR
jgi:hypothetical protein